MRRNPIQHCKQRGFTLVSAVFVVVVVSMLAGFLVNIESGQRGTGVLRLMSARAERAAQSGMEWAVARVLIDDACIADGTRFALAGPALRGFEVELNCTATAVVEGVRRYQTFTLRAFARYGRPGGEDYFQRQLVANVTSAR